MLKIRKEGVLRVAWVLPRNEAEYVIAQFQFLQGRCAPLDNTRQIPWRYIEPGSWNISNKQSRREGSKTRKGVCGKGLGLRLSGGGWGWGWEWGFKVLSPVPVELKSWWRGGVSSRPTEKLDESRCSNRGELK